MPTPQETAEGLLNEAADFLRHGSANIRYALMVLETLEMELRRTPKAPEPQSATPPPPCPN